MWVNAPKSMIQYRRRRTR